MARILVVDDEQFVRDLVRTYLDGSGHAIVEASDGLEALEAFRREPADLVISDNAMPKMTGAEMIEILRREQPDVKILAMSGLELDLGSGMVDGVLPKPFMREEFLAAVGQLIEI